MSNIKKAVVLFVILLFVNLPLVSALQFSDVTAKVTENSAIVSWQTDEPADSFVRYGTDKSLLTPIGDSADLTSHSLAISGLQPETAYVYEVESNNEIDNNNGSFYTFTTPAPDTTPPKLEVNLSTEVQGTSLEITGTTEADIEIIFLLGTIEVKRITSKAFMKYMKGLKNEII